jgi:hypothetical protein
LTQGKIFDSLADALDFVSKVKLTGITKVCEHIIERKRVRSFYGDAPFRVCHSVYNGCNFTFFKENYSKNREGFKSLYFRIQRIFCDYYVGVSRFDNPFIPAKIMLEKVGNITRVYEEISYYDWVEKEIIAEY